MSNIVQRLTEREKQTLRLIVRGHDAKSTARELGLSVHTINERLRDARRKLEVSSSREAARLLLDAEETGHENVRDRLFGYDLGPQSVPSGDAVEVTTGRTVASVRTSWIVGGGLTMSLLFGLVALLSGQPPSAAPVAPVSAAVAPSQADAAARRFLELVDAGRWRDSYDAAGSTFRKLNSLKGWTSAATQVRAWRGVALKRTLIAEDFVPAPPNGVRSVKYRTQFTKGGEGLETVSLDEENGLWRVVGLTIE